MKKEQGKSEEGPENNEQYLINTLRISSLLSFSLQFVFLFGNNELSEFSSSFMRFDCCWTSAVVNSNGATGRLINIFQKYKSSWTKS